MGVKYLKNHMKKWTIAFQYWQLVICRRGVQQLPDADREYQIFDSLSPALKALTEEKCDVWLWVDGPMHEVVDYFMQHYIYVKAAGGLVRYGDELLLIDRNQHWDMAKGKVEPGETLAQAALREVEEETGLQQLVLGPLALKTYHIYDLYGGWHLKQTSWFHMSSPTPGPLTPQTEEGIAQACWTPLGEAKARLEKSYSMMNLIASKL